MDLLLFDDEYLVSFGDDLGDVLWNLVPFECSPLNAQQNESYAYHVNGHGHIPGWSKLIGCYDP